MLAALPFSVGAATIHLPAVLPTAAVALVAGFALDAASAYKAHPSYRRMRVPFFIALARCENPLEVAGNESEVDHGETARETTLYALAAERRADLTVEHALWIATFHVHLILACGAVLLAGALVADLILHVHQIRSGGLAALALLYAALAAVFLRAASTRLQSYNSKIVSLTRARLVASYPESLQSAIVKTMGGSADPGPGYEAYRVAAASHTDQVRDDGEPYVFHVVRVALSLRCELDVTDSETLVLALLHDVLESPLDRRPELRQLSDAFGQDLVADCVTLTAKSGATQAERDQHYAEALRRSSSRVRLVKMCDRIDNVRSLASNPDRSKRARYLRETERYYLDLASMTNPTALKLLEQAMAGTRTVVGLPTDAELARSGSVPTSG